MIVPAARPPSTPAVILPPSARAWVGAADALTMIAHIDNTAALIMFVSVGDGQVNVCMWAFKD